MAFVDSGGLRIAYTTEGSGEPTILLLMGLGARAADWGTEFPAALAQRHRVVRMDNRGTGASEKPATTWALEDMATDAIAVLDAVGASRAHVIGLSMGGMIAQLVALLHPERVDRLVLMSTHYGGANVVPPTPEMFALYSPAAGSTAEDIMRLAVRMITAPGFADSNPQAVEALVELARNSPTSKRVFTTQLQAILSSDRSERVGAIRAPTLVIHGDLDPLIPCDNGRKLAASIPNAKLEILEGCGHVPAWECPKKLAERVLAFLA